MHDLRRGTASRPWCSATAASGSRRCARLPSSARCSTMARTEAIPYGGDASRACSDGTGRRSPSTSTSLDRTRRTASTVIQYMPTASLMTYVMGLEAAKIAPADEPSARRCSACCTRAWTPGCAGFSIQRLGPNSVQADFDGSPMVTDTMCDEDILAFINDCSAGGRGLHPNHAGHGNLGPIECSRRRWPQSAHGRSSGT